MEKDMEKDMEKVQEGFRARLGKATTYLVIGLTVGFILGLSLSAVIGERTHRQALVKDSDRIALSGEYTAVLVQRERLLANGDIEVLDSKVIKVYR